MKMKTLVSIDLLLKIYQQATRDLKAEMEQEIPRLNERFSEIGTWYGKKDFGEFAFLFNGVFSQHQIGFDSSGEWSEQLAIYKREASEGLYYPLDDKKVEKLLINHASKIGYEKGNFKCLVGREEDFSANKDKWYFDGRCLYTAPSGQGGSCLFSKGSWAEITSPIATETISEEVSYLQTEPEACCLTEACVPVDSDPIDADPTSWPVNVWYKGSENMLVFVKEIIGEFGTDYSVIGYGFGRSGVFLDNREPWSSRDLRLATTQEIESALINEAHKRGFLVGSTYDSLITEGFLCEKQTLINSEPSYCSYRSALVSNFGVIFIDGKWAESPTTKEDEVVSTMTITEEKISDMPARSSLLKELETLKSMLAVMEEEVEELSKRINQL